MKQIALAGLAALLLTACTPDTPDVTPPPDSDAAVAEDEGTALDTAEGAVPTGMDDTCRAQRFADRIGQPIEGADFAGADTLRVLRPGQLFSEDYVPTRLNVGVSRGGTIFRLWCG